MHGSLSNIIPQSKVNPYYSFNCKDPHTANKMRSFHPQIIAPLKIRTLEKVGGIDFNSNK